MFTGRYIRLYRLLLMAASVMVLSVLVLSPVSSAPREVLWTSGAVSGVLLAALYLLLGFVKRLIDGMSVPRIQRAIVFGAMSLLFTLCWTGAEMLLLWIFFPPGAVSSLLTVIPIKIVISFLIYAIMIGASATASTSGAEPAGECGGEPDSAADDEEPAPASALASAPAPVPASAPAPPAETIDHIAIKNGQKINLVMVSDITAIQAEGDYVMINTPEGRHLKEQTMKYYADRLPRGKFVRVHRSAIVNIDHIVRIESYEKQQQLITLTGGLRIRASVAGYKELKQTLNL